MTTPNRLPACAELVDSVPRDDDEGFGMLESALGRLPLKALDVRARITGLVAETVVEQTFESGFEKPIEATYVFPLPDRAAVTAFRMEIGDRVVKGLLKERGEARQVYADAIAKGHRAAITEEDRPGVFTMQVGNLMPGDVAKVRLVMVGPVIYDDGEATYRFPLVVAPRYMPGTPIGDAPVGEGTALDTDAVPDASRISPPVLLPGLKSPVRLSLSVDVDPAGLPLSDLRSSLHATEEDEAEGIRRVRLLPDERLNRDFVLRYRLGDEAVQTAVSFAGDGDDVGEGLEGDGTFLLTVLPPARPAAGSRPRDVVFVLDRSGSMSGWKMIAARRAVGRMLDTLGRSDRFAVLAFDHAVETVGPDGVDGLLVDATDRNRFRTLEKLSGIDARGGTEMARPLDEAVSRLGLSTGDARERILVLVTDGQVGNEDQILATLADRLGDKRVMTLGIDRAVNEGFLRRLAAVGGGWCDVVESEDRLDEAMDRLHRRIGRPVITDLRVEGEHIAAESLVPGRLPDLFEGAPLRILGRHAGRSPGPIRVTGRDAFDDAWSVTLTPTATETDALRAEWGRGRVRDLEDRYAARPSDDLAAEIVRSSLGSVVLCRFTAFVAVDESEVVNAGGKNETVVQPVEAPEGWAMFGAADALCDMEDAGPPMALSSAMPPPGAMPAQAPRPASAREEAARSRGAASSRKQAPPASGGGGILNRLGMGRRRPSPTDDEGAAIGGAAFPLTAYRRRAGDLVAALEGLTGEAALRRIAPDLKRLVDDLKSVGAPEAETAALVALLAEVKAALADPGGTDLDGLVARCRQVLEAFAGGETAGRPAPAAGPGPAKAGRAFWK